jgi:hypothetical protein
LLIENKKLKAEIILSALDERPTTIQIKNSFALF